MNEVTFLSHMYSWNFLFHLNKECTNARDFYFEEVEVSSSIFS